MCLHASLNSKNYPGVIPQDWWTPLKSERAGKDRMETKKNRGHGCNYYGDWVGLEGTRKDQSPTFK